MATQLQLRKGTKIQNDAFTGAEAELTYDTTTKGLRIHDGETQGGNIIDTVVFFQAPTAENNYTWARKYASGWVEQGGNYDAGSYSSSISADIIYPVEMADTRYTKLFGCEKDSDSSWAGYLGYINPTTTGVTLRYWNNIGTSVRYISWQISGMAA